MNCPVCQGSGELELPARGIVPGFGRGSGFRAGNGFEHGSGGETSGPGTGDGPREHSGVFLACYRCGGSGVLEDWE
ncbi:MAG: hypothetical protein BAA02_01515 [Paenibacillaceae bacterium ZCTH02-B3]|nr:MAG: hypothetical protein BAA02_01515 [Paenibacillaceae bacterium ZCTH02-B3]